MPPASSEDQCHRVWIESGSSLDRIIHRFQPLPHAALSAVQARVMLHDDLIPPNAPPCPHCDSPVMIPWRGWWESRRVPWTPEEDVLVMSKLSRTKIAQLTGRTLWSITGRRALLKQQHGIADA